MVRGRAEFSVAECAFLVSRVLESPLCSLEPNLRTRDANQLRQDTWESIRNDFVQYCADGGIQRMVTVGQLQMKYKNTYQSARKKYARLTRDLVEGVPYGELPITLNDAEERILATYRDTPSFRGNQGFMEPTIGWLEDYELIHVQHPQTTSDPGIASQDVKTEECESLMGSGEDVAETQQRKRVLSAEDDVLRTSDSEGNVRPVKKRRRGPSDAVVSLLKDIKQETKRNGEIMQNLTQAVCSLVQVVKQRQTDVPAEIVSRAANIIEKFNGFQH